MGGDDENGPKRRVLPSSGPRYVFSESYLLRFSLYQLMILRFYIVMTMSGWTAMTRTGLNDVKLSFGIFFNSLAFFLY